MTTELVFLDIETTGLDPALHEMWEIAWAINDGPIETRVVPHSIRTADPKALELNGYWHRGEGYVSHRADHTLRAILDGATIVGANPAFDTSFLRARWGVAPWHHRLIDVEAMALGLLSYDRPKGLHALAADLGVSEPDHTAAGDVHTTREVYNALRALAVKIGA